MTLKTLLATLPSHLEPSICFVQVQCLIAVYECGLGMTQPAYLTLSSAFTSVALIGCKEEDPLDSLRCSVALMTLDR